MKKWQSYNNDRYIMLQTFEKKSRASSTVTQKLLANLTLLPNMQSLLKSLLRWLVIAPTFCTTRYRLNRHYYLKLCYLFTADMGSTDLLTTGQVWKAERRFNLLGQFGFDEISPSCRQQITWILPSFKQLNINITYPRIPHTNQIIPQK